MPFSPSPNVVSGPTRMSGSLHQVTGTLSVLGAISSSLGISPLGAGADSIQIGTNASAPNVDSIAIGKDAVGQGDEGIALGEGANTYTAGGIAIGWYTQANGSGKPLAIGYNANASQNNCIAIGSYETGPNRGAFAAGNAAIALGVGATAESDFAIGIGYLASGSADNAIAIGYLATGSAANSVAIGSGSNNVTANSMTIGNVAQTMDLNVTGNVSINQGALIGGQPETIGGSAAPTTMSSTKFITLIDDSSNTSGQTTFALAVGVLGQIKIITMTVAAGGGSSGNPQLANTNLAANISAGITWTNPGDTVILVCNGTKWAVAGSYGASIS